MPLITFGIDKDRNLIIQFPVFVQPYTQKAFSAISVRNFTHSYFGSEHQGAFIHTFANQETIYCPNLRDLYLLDIAGIKSM